jgi:hypothetical protein
MNKSKAARVAGFIGALGASAALVGAAVNTTGAYFTDSKAGTINAGTGTVKITAGSDTKLNFENLLPGEDKTQQVSYQALGTGKQDLWFVLDPATSKQLTGPDGLGRYGHFKLSSDGGASFESYNLTDNAPSGSGDARCPDNGYGSGGSNAPVASLSDPPPPYCAVPKAILLQQNMNYGDVGTTTITFGFTKFLKNKSADGTVNFQGQSTKLLAGYKLVATQHGIRPDDANN